MPLAITEPLYDPLVTSWRGEPYETYRVLRDEHPVYHCGPRDTYVLSRFDDVRQAARDWKRLSSTPSVDLDETGDAMLGAGSFIDTDPPDHARMRKVIRARFNPVSIRQRFEDAIRRDISRRVEQLLERGGGDFARDLAWGLPVAMVCMLMGVPTEDVSRLRPWFEDLASRCEGDPTPPAHASQAAASLRDYLCESVNERVRHPQDDLLGDLASGMRAGTLSADEVRGMCVLLCLAGTETTASLIGNSLYLLGQHLPARDSLSRNPTQIPRAVEEVIRLESPVQYLARTATTDFEMHGVTVNRGSRVVLLWGAANRDERAFPAADTIDFGRTKSRHVGFGEGIHHCIGAPLARMECRMVLEAIVPHVDYAFDGPVVRMPSHSARGFSSLPVACKGGRRASVTPGGSG